MTALERIKDLENIVKTGDTRLTIGFYNSEFLLRAFQAMRNIAWESGNKSTEEIDAMFEERMKDKN